MAKQQRRKPPKRAAAKPPIDDDLAELVSMLAESKLDDNATGWFQVPWRDGWAAARLGIDCWYAVTTNLANTGAATARQVGTWIKARNISPRIYEHAEIVLLDASADVFRRGAPDARFLVAALRCVQLLIANSSGGGHGYNDVLRLAVERVPDSFISMIAPQVKKARCFDAIGVELGLRNDKNDKLRRAFSIAWDRGLYQAAYALPRATAYAFDGVGRSASR